MVEGKIYYIREVRVSGIGRIRPAEQVSGGGSEVEGEVKKGGQGG